MRVVVQGLGCVGSTTAAWLAEAGHEVLAVDPDLRRVHAIGEGRSPVTEPGLGDLVGRHVAAGRLQAVRDWPLHNSEAPHDAFFVCVGTPVGADGAVDLSAVEQACLEVGRALSRSRQYHVVVLRSTVPPRTTRGRVKPLLEAASGRRAGEDFGLAVVPEFLRQGSALNDLLSASNRMLVGELDERTGRAVAKLVPAESPVTRMSLEEAELAKLATNAFHALRVGFANEVGRLADRLDLDGRRVMSLVAEDPLSAGGAYLTPGQPFGGSCLPKDLRLLLQTAEQSEVRLPVLAELAASNRSQLDHILSWIKERNARSVAILGVVYKPNTADLRDSPALTLIADLGALGITVTAFDPEAAACSGLRREGRAVDEMLRLALRPSAQAAVAHADSIVVFDHRPEFTDCVAGLPANIEVLDLGWA